MKNNSTHNLNYDVIIVGGGIVGASLALGLSQLPLKIAVFDPAYSPEMPHISDGRTLALSATSCKILQALCFGSIPVGFQDAKLLDKLPSHPIKTIHISEQNRFATTRLKASDIGLLALGYSIEMTSIVRFLYEELAKTNCDLIPEKVKDAKSKATGFEVMLENKTITTKLLIAADGDHSFLRGLMKIPVITHDYGQSALITTVEISGKHDDTAFERFIHKGSIALLPITEKKMKLVWITDTDAIHTLAHLTPEALLIKLQEHMGRRLGTFHTLAKRHFIYPLKFQYTSQQVMPNFVLMGNAAHTLHPIAAQGFNLSLRDIALLVETMRQTLADEQEIGSEKTLQAYLQKRLPDQRYAQNLTHYLANGFTQDFGLGSIIRRATLNSFEYLPLIKKQFTRRAIGSSTLLPRWVYLTD